MILFVYSEHFPKPGTKADARMLLEDDKNIEETSESNSCSDSDDTTRVCSSFKSSSVPTSITPGKLAASAK